MNINKNKIILLLINLITISFFIESVYTYNKRNEIISSNNFIKKEEYKIIKFYCSCHSKRSSSIKVEFNSNEYIVAIGCRDCENWEKNNIESKLYYNSNSNNIFTKSGLAKRMFVIGSLPILLFISFWFIPFFKKQL